MNLFGMLCGIEKAIERFGNNFKQNKINVKLTTTYAK